MQTTFSNGPGVGGEWVGLFPVGTSGAGGYIDWQWTTGGQGAPGMAMSGTLTFPTGGHALTPGAYQFRWISAANTVLAQSPTVTFAVINPTPTITSLSPASLAAGSVAFTLTVTGTGFVSGAAVNLDGASRTLAFVSATQMTAAIPATDVTSVGTHTITVVNPTACVASQCTTNGATLTMTPPPAAPTLSSISPTSVSWRAAPRSH